MVQRHGSGNVIGSRSGDLSHDCLVGFGQAIEQAALAGVWQAGQNDFRTVAVDVSSTDLLDDFVERIFAVAELAEHLFLRDELNVFFHKIEARFDFCERAE